MNEAFGWKLAYKQKATGTSSEAKPHLNKRVLSVFVLFVFLVRFVFETLIVIVRVNVKVKRLGRHSPEAVHTHHPSLP